MTSALFADAASTDGRIVVIVAVLGAVATVAAAWAQGAATRRHVTAANEKAEQAQTLAATVADSVGPKNGHGTVQDVTGVLLAESRELRDEIREELRATRTTVEVLVTSASAVNDRLKGHDREIAALKHPREDDQ